jgi:hypothetical protein
LGDGYGELGGRMTFTVWAFPAADKPGSHLLDLGNGDDADNIIVGRWDTTAGFAFHNYSGMNRSTLIAPGQLVQDQWQMLGVTVSGRAVKLYKNGAQVLSDSVDFPISALPRYLCFLGRSNSAQSDYFQGKLDEAELSETVRGADWMKFSYQNQKPGQSIPAIRKAPACARSFGVPADTSAPGGSEMFLKAQADCASNVAWSVSSGPPVRILDPERTDLNIALPLVADDTVLILRFTAVFGDSIRSGDVRIHVEGAQPTSLSLLPTTRDRTGDGAGNALPAAGPDRDALGRAAARPRDRTRTRSQGLKCR